MYYQTLATLDYRIPAAAGPFLLRAIDAFREARRKETATVLDVGSSYGINAAILKHGYDLVDLYGLYGPAATKGVEPEALLDRDRALFGGGNGDETLTTIGLDVAGDAIAYAREAGIIDRGITANLEERRATPDEAAELLPVDVVVSTGAVGYVGVPTFDRILDEARRKPWFASPRSTSIPLAAKPTGGCMRSSSWRGRRARWPKQPSPTSSRSELGSTRVPQGFSPRAPG
jgi:hypothetical protein